MINKLLFLLLVGLIVIIFSIKNLENKSSSRNNSLGALTSSNTFRTHPLIFFDKDNFYEGIAKDQNDNKRFAYRVAGGVIPHHLFPSFIIADFFSQLSHQNPKTIILIGPNHYELGDFKVLTSLYGWQTPFGVVEPNELFTYELMESNLAKIDEEVLPKEHSVAGIMPFVKYYLPNVQVVPIILSGFMTQEETQLFANSLKNFMNKDTVVIAAVDFSHYLTNKEAYEKDKVTLEIMKNFDYRQLFSLNNDYLDSPASVAALLMIMQALRTTNMDLLQHTNSGELQRDDYIETTSYFSIAYY